MIIIMASSMYLIVHKRILLPGHSAISALCLYILLFFLSGFAEAKVIRSSIEFVEPDMLFLESGDVVYLKENDKQFIGLEGTRARFQLDQHHNLISVRSLPPKRYKSLKFVNRPYTPTVLADLNQAHAIYSRMRKDYREEAQCFNMAHVWAYEEFKRSKLLSMKMFLFFTRKYIRKHRFHWWFHVSPMVYVKDNGQTVPLILDRRYTLSPFDIKTWTDHFIVSQKSCKQVDKFYDYYKHQESEDCYLILRNMFYWQPRSIRLGDQAEGELSAFRSSEVRAARAGF